MSTEKPMAKAAEPSRPLRLSSVTAKMQTTSCRVRKISIVVAMPRLIPGCSWKNKSDSELMQGIFKDHQHTVIFLKCKAFVVADGWKVRWLTVLRARFPLMLLGVTP